tara:strand:- start:61 stop:240 length:180 start_codon:yes stop_codon:yes gene_type:complete
VAFVVLVLEKSESRRLHAFFLSLIFLMSAVQYDININNSNDTTSSSLVPGWLAGTRELK